MESKDVLQALLQVWDKLPRLVGPAWLEVYARLRYLLSQLETAGDSEKRSWLVNEMVLVFRQYHEAGRLLREVIGRLGQEGPRGISEQPECVPDEGEKTWDELVNRLSRRLDVFTVSRYTDIACPRRVWVKTPRLSVVIRLTAQPNEFSASVEKLSVREGLPVQVHIEAPGFEVLNAPQQETPVLPDQDSPPAVFDLRPQTVGDFRIKLDFYQDANPLGTVSVPIECTSYETTEETVFSSGFPMHMDTDAEPPDLMLYIAWQESPPTLFFKLWEGGRWQSFAPIRLKRDPSTDAAGFYRHLTGLTVHADPTVKVPQNTVSFLGPKAVDRRVKALGQNIWRDLIPDDLKMYYKAQRERWRNRSMLVVSDEPYLPWEFVWPYKPGDWEDEMPWCCTMRLTRWLRSDLQGNGIQKPPTWIQIHRLAILAPTNAELPNAQEERTMLLEAASGHRIEDVSPEQATWEAMMDLLEGGCYDWLHMASHGKFHQQTPDVDAVIWLEGQVSFTPKDIVGARIEGHIMEHRPAFVLNACEGGRIGLGLTGLAGWAMRLVGTGAGLFIGPQWVITDESGLSFAEAFYQSIFRGETIAGAVQQARLNARQTGDPTWLSYTVYAHPNARVVL